MKPITEKTRRRLVLLSSLLASLCHTTTALSQSPTTPQAQSATTREDSKPPAADPNKPKQSWGDLKIRFLYDGPAPAPNRLAINKDVNVYGNKNLVDESLIVGKDGSLSNLVLWVRQPKVPVHPSYAAQKEIEATIQSAGGQITPRITACQTGQPLELRNLDPVALNLHAQSQVDPFNIVLRANSSVKRSPFRQAEPRPIPVSSNIHSWKHGWLIVQPHPYVGISDHEGRIELKNMPADMPLELQVWHERCGYVTKATVGGKETTWPRGRLTLTLNPGENDLGEIKLAPALLNPLPPNPEQPAPAPAAEPKAAPPVNGT